MFWPIGTILVLLWALGLITAYTSSGVMHILLVLAIVIVLNVVLQRRRPI